MHLILLTVTAACVVSTVYCQAVTTMRWNQFCDDSLANCTKNYFHGARNKTTTRQYQICVFRVFCERWSEGFYNRQNILSEIQGRLEFYDPEAGQWWENGSNNLGMSSAVVLISALVSLTVPSSVPH